MYVSRLLCKEIFYLLLQSLAEAAIKQADTAKIIVENYCQLNVLNKQKLILKEKQLQIDENLLQVLDNVHGLIEKILNKHT